MESAGKRGGAAGKKERSGVGKERQVPSTKQQRHFRITFKNFMNS